MGNAECGTETQSFACSRSAPFSLDLRMLDCPSRTELVLVIRGSANGFNSLRMLCSAATVKQYRKSTKSSSEWLSC